MTIREITEDDFHFLVGWNKRKEADFLQQWAGPVAYEYPISQRQIAERIDEGSRIYIIEENAEVIGTFELDMNEGKKQAFLSRVLFDETKTGKGYGTKAMKCMQDMVFQNPKMNKIILHVYCYNIAAIRCYEKSGFRTTAYHVAENAKWNSLTMECRK